MQPQRKGNEKDDGADIGYFGLGMDSLRCSGTLLGFCLLLGTIVGRGLGTLLSDRRCNSFLVWK